MNDSSYVHCDLHSKLHIHVHYMGNLELFTFRYLSEKLETASLGHKKQVFVFNFPRTQDPLLHNPANLCLQGTRFPFQNVLCHFSIAQLEPRLWPKSEDYESTLPSPMRCNEHFITWLSVYFISFVYFIFTFFFHVSVIIIITFQTILQQTLRMYCIDTPRKQCQKAVMQVHFIVYNEDIACKSWSLQPNLVFQRRDRLHR